MKIQFIFVFIAAFLGAGCASTDEPVVPYGSVAGRIILRAMPRDQFGAPSQDYTGFIVTHPNTGVDVMSTDGGLCVLEDVTPGSQSLRVRRPGWGDVRYVAGYTGGPADWVAAFSMNAPSTVEIKGFRVKSVTPGSNPGDYYVSLGGTLLHPGISGKYIRLQVFGDTLNTPTPNSQYFIGYNMGYFSDTDSTEFSFGINMYLAGKIPASKKVNIRMFSGYGNYSINHEDNTPYMDGLLASDIVSVNL